MAGYESLKDELAATDAKVVLAGSVDGEDKYPELGADLTCPGAVNMTREQGNSVGSWWEDRRSIIQPSEFILGPDNKVVASSYADGPLGRLEAGDVVKLINFYESR